MGTIVRGFSQWATEQGYLLANPAAGLEVAKVQSWQVHILSEAEVNALLAHLHRGESFARKRNYCLTLFLLGTGLRAGECLDLRASDLPDRDAGDGPGARSANGLAVTAGDGRHRREVPLPTGVASVLRPYLAERARYVAQFAQAGLAATDCLWPSERNAPLSRDAFAHALTQAARAAGLDATRIHAQALRHTFAVSFLRQGGQPAALQQLLGGCEPALLRRYVRLAEVPPESVLAVHDPLARYSLPHQASRPSFRPNRKRY
jgi:integrase/recombinase XerD